MPLKLPITVSLRPGAVVRPGIVALPAPASTSVGTDTQQAGELSVPWQTVGKVLGLFGGTTGLVTFLGLWLRDLPNAAAARDRSERCGALSILAPALKLEAPADRAVALRFLVSAGIVADGEQRLIRLAAHPESIPRLDVAGAAAACNGIAGSSSGPASPIVPPTGAVNAGQPIGGITAPPPIKPQ